MCGILGIYDRRGDRVDPDHVVHLRDAMIHRGPDDAGLWCNERVDVILAHRRLAIIDLSPAGRAPMGNEDGSVQVTFNGEIYNHVALREDLERRGHVFRSHCDTEVLVHLYEEYGRAMVDHLVGMFAFAIWDTRADELFLARDRLGIKPLYWVDHGGRFGFASEIKALLDLLPRREIDPVALSHYLTFVAVPPPRTLFAGVSKLAPGTTMVVGRDGIRSVQRFWDPLSNRVEFNGAIDDWEAEFRVRLERSVERRMMSDVPVGVFLSGGVDSSTNVALMDRHTPDPINTFSIGFEDAEGLNEFGWARQIADRFYTNHHEVRIGEDDLWDFLPQLVFHQDEPIADPVCVPLYFVSKLAKDNGVTVVHVGEGADELLAGYPTYVTAHRYATRYWPRLRALPQVLRTALSTAGDSLLPLYPSGEIQVEALRRAAQPDGQLWWGGAVAFYESGLSRVTTPAFRGQLNGDGPREVVAGIQRDATAGGARDALDRLIYQDLRLRLPELLLMRVDKLTMANAVEARVPFLDHELVELAMSLPVEEKIKDRVGKQVLKRTVEDLLPQELIWRKKQGFSTPVSQWFRGDAGGQLEQRLRESAIHELGWLDRDAIGRVLDIHRSGRADRSFQLWNLLNLGTWFDHWIAGRDPVGV